MLIAFAVCPHPALLVPALAPQRSDDLDAVRVAGRSAVEAILTDDVEQIIVLTAGDHDEQWGPQARADLGPYGLVGARPDPALRLPLGLSVGAWLLDEAGSIVPRTYRTTTGGPTPIGTVPTALLVMVDGSAKRSPTAPGSLDDRAAAYDHEVVTAIERADPDALERLDPALGAELWMHGLPALHALGATLREAGVATGAASPAELLYDAAPFGVGYWVARWRARTG